jgi:hypothetical protein
LTAGKVGLISFNGDVRHDNFVASTISGPPATATSQPPPSGLSSYDTLILSYNPVAYWPFVAGSGTDVSGHGLNGSFTGSPISASMPNGDNAIVYNGTDQYFAVPDNDYLEIVRTGKLTVEAWIRPDVLQFPDYDSTGYVNWMGKGGAGQHAYVSRIYNLTNDENRPNRISGYAFNLTGGLGIGSYFQDTVTPGRWIHYALIINIVDTSSSYPTGYTKIFKNGALRDQDNLQGYNIVPGNGTAPFRVGTYTTSSFFEGAIGKVAIYDDELTPAQLVKHYQAMGSPVP